MSIHARFIGKTSCGFVSGNVYDIRINTTGRRVTVNDTKSAASCPYASIQAFIKNWEFPIVEVKSMATENKKSHEDLEKAYLEHLYRIIDVDTRAEAFEDPERAIDHTVRDATVMRAFELIQLYKLANTTGDAKRALAQGLGDIVRKIH